MIGIGEGSLVVLSLRITLVSPHESLIPRDKLPSTLMGAPLGLWFGSGSVRFLCCCLRLIDCHKDTCWGVCISCVPSSGTFVTSKMNSVKYYQLMELPTLSLSPTWLIPTSVEKLRAAELSSTGFISFTLCMDDILYLLKSQLFS